MATEADAAESTLLAVCTRPPWPVRDGYGLRVANLLEGLAGAWRITLVAPTDVVPCAITCVPVALTGSGLTYPWRFDDAPLRAAVRTALAERPAARALVFPGAEAVWFDDAGLPPAVMDMIDCNPLEFWRAALSGRGLRARLRSLAEVPVAIRYARRTVWSFSATVLVGERDAAWMRRIGGRDTVHVVPNGVAVPPTERLVEEDVVPTVVFLGSLGYAPNVDATLFAAEQIWPRIAEAVPGARFVIAGRAPAPEIRALAAQPGIVVAADVPDIVTVLGRAWVSVAPMRIGVGIKNKVLEAWACARPVVMTPLATNGLVLPPGHGAFVRRDPAGLADAIVTLLRDRAARQAAGASARALVRERFSWAGAAARIDALLRAAR
ncbi:glycosyltransferase [Elioraea sp.]|uniref:glycosyltransferase n=1 Tax=Elioraea sp. TaxID=2185103 RepID=UPI003F70B990